jgi:hypothetical protein
MGERMTPPAGSTLSPKLDFIHLDAGMVGAERGSAAWRAVTRYDNEC